MAYNDQAIIPVRGVKTNRKLKLNPILKRSKEDEKVTVFKLKKLKKLLLE